MTGLDLKIKRVGLRLRQFEVAAALDLHPSVLCAIENDRRPVSSDQTSKIIGAMQQLCSKRNAVCDDCAA
jgi:predicted transcriptional regulator